MIDLFVHHAPVIALIWFFIGFIGIAIWAYLPGNREKLQKNADIPFKE